MFLQSCSLDLWDFSCKSGIRTKRGDLIARPPLLLRCLHIEVQCDLLGWLTVIQLGKIDRGRRFCRHCPFHPHRTGCRRRLLRP